MTGAAKGMFAELRDRIDAGVTCICEVSTKTRIEKSRLGQLLYGNARPQAYEEFLAMYALLAMIDQDDQDPLLRKLRRLTEADVARPSREAVMAAMRRLFADAERECLAAEGQDGVQ